MHVGNGVIQYIYIFSVLLSTCVLAATASFACCVLPWAISSTAILILWIPSVTLLNLSVKLALWLLNFPKTIQDVFCLKKQNILCLQHRTLLLWSYILFRCADLLLLFSSSFFSLILFCPIHTINWYVHSFF